MLMRLQELEEEARTKIIVVVGMDNPEISTDPIEIFAPPSYQYEPLLLQSEFDELPQKIKHRKKRKYHN